ncbi:MAG TPA: TetR/AcrR family transcriptional regulator [Actinomycetota bacterium]|nr:TetR/AcrR family transcriptional regulator [Actinomycetota bacterium]
MTPRTERGRRTRATLLAAARKAFEERGFDDCRMNDIADAAAVSHGTVYTYFSSKEELLGQVVDELLVELQDDLRTSSKDPMQRIDAANRHYLSAYQQNSRLLRVIEQASVTHPEMGQRLDDFRRRYHARVSQALRRLQEQGRVRPDLPADVTATALCAMVEGFSRYWDQDYTDDINETLTRLWVNALGLRDEVA